MDRDPGYAGKGLVAGGRLERAVWEEFAADPALLRPVAKAIRRSYRLVEPVGAKELEEEAFPEGKVLYRLHQTQERSVELVRRAKEKALDEHGRLACVVCAFDFEAACGAVGRGFIECHHLLHRKRPWLRPEQLSALLMIPPDPKDGVPTLGPPPG